MGSTPGSIPNPWKTASASFFCSRRPSPHTYKQYTALVDLVTENMADPTPSPGLPDYPTVYLSDKISGLSTQEEMLEFARENAPVFRQAYSKLYSYINAYLAINLRSEHHLREDGRGPSFNAMANASGWPSSLRHCISDIRSRRWFPLRHSVIALGLYLNMDTEGIDQMLRYAQMEPLSARSPVEAAIKWAVQEMALTSIEDVILQDGSSDLVDYVRDVLKQLDLSDYLIDL